MYSEAVADENYLRGVQETDADGTRGVHHDLPRPATPAAGRTCTSRSTSRSTPRRAYTNKLRTSQLALPRGRRATTVYGDADGLRRQRRPTSPSVSLDSDGVFSDGYSLQLATVTGSVDEGYTSR